MKPVLGRAREILSFASVRPAILAVAGAMLLLLGIIKPGMSADELIGKITLHAVPCSIGAILARRRRLPPCLAIDAQAETVCTV